MSELTEKQKEFARLLVEGRLSKPDAYRKAFNKSGMKGEAASKAASRLSKKAEVLAYMDSLSRELDKSAIMSRQERMEWLSRVVRTPIKEVDESSDLCQESVIGEEIKTKMPSKLGAIAELNKMDGAYEPEKIEIDAGEGLADLLGKVAFRHPVAKSSS